MAVISDFEYGYLVGIATFAEGATETPLVTAAVPLTKKQKKEAKLTKQLNKERNKYEKALAKKPKLLGSSKLGKAWGNAYNKEYAKTYGKYMKDYTDKEGNLLTNNKTRKLLAEQQNKELQNLIRQGNVNWRGLNEEGRAALRGQADEIASARLTNKLMGQAKMRAQLNSIGSGVKGLWKKGGTTGKLLVGGGALGAAGLGAGLGYMGYRALRGDQ